MDISLRYAKIKGTARPPCSKSYAQRALAAALLAEGRTTLRNAEPCDDTLAALRCIETLGAKIAREERDTITIEGGLMPLGNRLLVGESGLAARLFTPIAALCDIPITIEGEGTLLHRPTQMMAGPLRALGVSVRDGGGRLPIEVCGPMHGGEITVDGSISSQFITGLLLALPLAGQETTIHAVGAVSTPYIDITMDTAEKFGVEICRNDDYTEFFIEGGQRYIPADFAIESDWSAAAILLVAGAIAGEVRVENMSMLSKQADTLICRALARAGASVVHEQNAISVYSRPLKAFTFDATNCPDLFPALAALAAAAEGVSTITGTRRLEFKECNRSEALKEEYAKLGIEIDLSTDNKMRIRGGKIVPARVDSRGDHRMAMSLAVSALRCRDGEVVIEEAECVAKSFPNFFATLDTLTVKA